LPSDLVNRARRYLGRDRVEAEAAAQRLDETQRELSAQAEEARREREEVASLRSLYEARLNKLENERDREIDKARREARLLVEQAQKEADETLKQLRLAARAGQASGGRENKGTEEARHRLRTLRERVHAAGKASPKPQVQLREVKATAHTLTEPPRVGDIVKVRSLDREGEVLRVEGQRIEVRVGAMKIDLKVGDLESTKSRSASVTGVAGIQSRKGYTVPEELQLLGKTTAEAIDELEKYLDDALLAGKDEVRVVHGRGTGALRGAVHQYLRRHRSVGEYHLAPQNEGGEGATIVKFA
jgi:DNA mismatch repair protein MutS2